MLSAYAVDVLRAGSLRPWEVVDFGVVIGMHRNSKTGHARPTTRGTIHYSKTGAHVVPTTPKKGKSR